VLVAPRNVFHSQAAVRRLIDRRVRL